MAQNLTTNIVINAKAGNGFNEVGSVLAEMGSIVNGISQELINFGKDSVDVYKNYEKSMTEAEIALSTKYGRGTRDLNEVMNNLDKAAAQWAASTIFHTDDVGDAIANAAHAGWDYDQIMSGIPAAMQLAQAGSLDLSDAVDYITKATHAAGIEFDDLGEFVDHWTYAANRSATDIEGMGDAMLKMGATMKFTGSSDDLLVMLAELANAGTVGSDAGTLLRNSMLRLVSPTKKARDVMEGLGAESEEIEEILNDEALAAANAQLATRGFSAYDDQGNLKNMLDIFTDLSAALDGMSEQEKNDILGSIFPTRSITGAMALLEAAKTNFHDLYDELQNGAAEGYGKYSQQTMMETLYGQIEWFDSKVEELKRKTGGSLAEDVTSALSGVGGFVDDLNAMDQGQFDALVSGLEVIAVAGPGIVAASTAFRFLGTVLSPAGGIALGVTALAAVVRYAHELSNLNLEKQFGEGTIDHTKISTFLSEIGSEFESSYQTVQVFNDQVKEAVSNYTSASEELTQGLLSDLVTDRELSEDDVKHYFELGENMRTAVLLGLQGNADSQNEFWTQLFGNGDYTTANQNESYQNIIDIINEDLNRSAQEVETTSWNLRRAMTAAFEDGHVSDEEYQNILSYTKDLNAAMARAQKEAQDEAEEKALWIAMNKGQTQSYDDLVATTNEIAGKRDEKLGVLEENYLGNIWDLQQAYDNNMAAIDAAIANARDPYTARMLQEERTRRQEAYETARKDAEAEYKAERAIWSDKYNTAIGTSWDSSLKASDASDAYAYLQELATSFASGEINMMEAARLFGNSEYYEDSANAIINGLTREIEGMGGASELVSTAMSFMSSGDIASAGRYMMPLIMQQIAGNMQDWVIHDNENNLLGAIMGGNWLWSNGHSTDEVMSGIGDFVETVNPEGYSVENARHALDMLQGTEVSGFFESLGLITDSITAFGEDLSEGDIASMTDQLTTQLDNLSIDEGISSQLSAMVEGLSAQYDLARVLTDTLGSSFVSSPVADYLGAYQLMFNEGLNAADYENPSVEVSLNPNTDELDAAMELEDGQHIETYVDGETNDLHMSIVDEDGQKITTFVLGNVDNLRAQIQQMNGMPIRVNLVSQMTAHAQGGRATTASIFGEAGPEWAIPEAHTQRTAELLNAAREASGFTWPELLSQFGGLNSGSSGVGSIVYSPVINANDASGIDQVLRDDKERLRRMLREERMLNAMEVYA